MLASAFIINILSVIIYWNLSVSYSGYSKASSYDCGIIFFHGITKQGTLSEDSKQRCELGANLFKTGKVRNIICAGGSTLKKPGSVIMRDYIKSLGLPDSSIILDSLSYSSITNLKEAGKIVGNKSFSSAILISSPTHMLRLKYLAEKYLPGTQNGYTTFSYDYSITDIFLDCNSEFIKWVYLLILPDSFTDFSKNILNGK